MTIEKAIEQLENLMHYAERCIVDERSKEIFGQDIQAYKMAIQALEKQLEERED